MEIIAPSVIDITSPLVSWKRDLGPPGGDRVGTRGVSAASQPPVKIL